MDEMNQKYPEVKKEFKNLDQKEMILNRGEIVPYPNDKTRDVLYVAGPSNSGKSTYASKFALEYHKLYARRNIYIFSRVTFDEAFDDAFNPIYIKLNDELLDKPITTKELENSLCIFDDIDTLTDDEIRKNVLKLRDDILETGRHNNISVLVTSHQISNYKQTRTILNEATEITIYPRSGSTYHIIRVLKVYCGLNIEQINRILNLPSRWVTIVKSYPLCVFYQTGIYLL